MRVRAIGAFETKQGGELGLREGSSCHSRKQQKCCPELLTGDEFSETDCH
jgi:hypothetical protein